jgi:hypothetical protein
MSTWRWGRAGDRYAHWHGCLELAILRQVAHYAGTPDKRWLSPNHDPAAEFRVDGLKALAQTGPRRFPHSQLPVHCGLGLIGRQKDDPGGRPQRLSEYQLFLDEKEPAEMAGQIDVHVKIGHERSALNAAGEPSYRWSIEEARKFRRKA